MCYGNVHIEICGCCTVVGGWAGKASHPRIEELSLRATSR
jgi:hypothetical protein